MSEILRSVGLDVGTTSTQLIFSELTVENRASSFAVPELEIARREVFYKSPVHFTPLVEENLVDAAALRRLVEEEYRNAGISRSSVDTGAIIITGETSRKENARAVLEALADLAGDFVVATAGPDLESVLAARGAGAVAYSQTTGKPVVHMDIGGGTSNLALIRDGKILQTTCLNVGGRLIKYNDNKVITYVSPVLKGIFDVKVGETMEKRTAQAVSDILVQALEMAVGLRPVTALMRNLTAKEAVSGWQIPTEEVVISFSGGVADCIGKEVAWDAFGDIGPDLGRAIRGSRLCHGEYVLGSETIRATVIGAGCHSTQLSGSTVFYRNVQLPLKNVPVVEILNVSAGEIRKELQKQEGPAILAMPGISAPSYQQVAALAEKILAGTGDLPVLVCLEADMAKALGQALALRSSPQRQILCIDRVKVGVGSFLDIGVPIGPALPVVVKTLILSR